LLLFDLFQSFELSENSILVEGRIQRIAYQSGDEDFLTNYYEIEYLYLDKEYSTKLNLPRFYDIGDTVELEISILDPSRVYSKAENIYFFEQGFYFVLILGVACICIHAFFFQKYPKDQDFSVTSTPSSH